MELRYPYQLPPLPYAYDALEDEISEKTLHFHHDKHLKSYIDNLNTALADRPEEQNKTLEELLRHLDCLSEPKRTAIRNNGGGVYNHLVYLNSYDDWRAAMKAAALGQFGSGYAWLVCERSGALSVLKTANQDSPLSLGLWPLLCVDVWEHAYYLDYQNRRPDYVERWFERIHWPFVQQRYEQR